MVEPEFQMLHGKWKNEVQPAIAMQGLRAIGEWIIFIDDDCVPNLAIYRLRSHNQNHRWSLEGRIFQIGKGDMRHALPMRQEDCFGPATLCQKNHFR